MLINGNSHLDHSVGFHIIIISVGDDVFIVSLHETFVLRSLICFLLRRGRVHEVRRRRRLFVVCPRERCFHLKHEPTIEFYRNILFKKIAQITKTSLSKKLYLAVDNLQRVALTGPQRNFDQRFQILPCSDEKKNTHIKFSIIIIDYYLRYLSK